MFKIIRDLFRYNGEFAAGAIMTAFVLIVAALSAFSPYPPNQTYVVPPDIAPSWQYLFGTTSRGQETFWQVTCALRNSLLFGFSVALISRVLSLVVGLVAGYRGGGVDRLLMSLNDTFLVIPLFPLLVMFYFVLRDRMNWGLISTGRLALKLLCRCSVSPTSTRRRSAPCSTGPTSTAVIIPKPTTFHVIEMIWSALFFTFDHRRRTSRASASLLPRSSHRSGRQTHCAESSLARGSKHHSPCR